MAEKDLAKIPYRDLVSGYSPHNDAEISLVYEEELAKNRRKIIVLDDDPTGVQTVHGVSVYTGWREEDIEAGFDEEATLFFILTNSRGMTAEETEKVHHDIGKTVAGVSRKKNRDYILISRSDSTLRGHYPLETEILKKALDDDSAAASRPEKSLFDAEIICPFFMEGGRFTAENIHYVKVDDMLVPAARTEFAADRIFGYTHSNLAEWIEEKTGGMFRKENVKAVTLKDLREGGTVESRVQKIAALLNEAENFNKVIVNALDYNDIKIFSAAFFRALNRGKRFLLRTAAAIPKALGGIKDKPLLTRADLLGDNTNRRGGLIVAGSHVQKTTRQLELLLENKNIIPIEFNVHLVTEDGKFAKETERVQVMCNNAIAAGKTTVIFTSRKRFDMDTGNREDELRVSLKIAGAVTGFVSRLPEQPRFIIAKGGITSSGIGTVALGVKKALVLGQVLPGVPVWLTGAESRFPNTPYIIFPGNVGNEGDLRRIADMLE